MNKINENAVFPVQPLFNKVIITLNNLEQDGDLVTSNNVLSDAQYIIAKGPSVHQVEVGNKVLIDIEKLMVPVKSETTDAYSMQLQIKVDPIEVDGVTYAIVEDRVIKAIDNRK